MTSINKPLRSPRLSIGMPVYNGAHTMRTAIDSLLAQDFEDFELLIADNGSIDDTSEIARLYCERDSRVRYVRHVNNLGALANFNYTIEHATGDYFMWAAADDLWSPDFAGLNTRFLDEHCDYISAISPVRYEGEQPNAARMGDGLLQDPALCKRVRDYLSLWHGNSVLYSVFRRRILSDSLYPTGSYLGFDWSMMLRATAHGPSKRLGHGFMSRGKKGGSSTGAIFQTSRSRGYHWLLPFADVSGEALRTVREQSTGCRLATTAALARLNYMAFRDQLYYELCVRHR